MKKINIYISIALLLFAVGACDKQLDLAPEDYYGQGNFWQTEAQATNYMAGLHTAFRGNMFMFNRLGEMRGGAYYNQDRMGVSLNELSIIEQNLSEQTPGISNWAGFYGNILDINIFLQNVEGSSLIPDASKRDYLLGQAYAMRAYYYFHLLRTYGGVPLRLQPDVILNRPDAVELRLARSPEEDVLAAVKADVDKAVQLFEGKTSAGKYLWNPDAAKMLKGEVYLWSGKVYNNTADLGVAKSTLESISGYELQSSFANTFSTKGNNEIIFALRYAVGEAEMPGVSLYTYDLFNFSGSHYADSSASSDVLADPLNIGQPNSQQIIQRYAYTYDLFKSYEPGDTRRDATFYSFYKLDKNTTPPTVTTRNTVLRKFLGEINANKRYFTSDWPIYREADRLLMLAEIANAQGEDPSQYIQPVRNRAFGGNDPNPFVNGTQDENELAIFEERVKEFVFEGKRWYDLRRMEVGGKPLAFMSSRHPYGVLDETTEAYKLLWPINTGIWTNDPLVDQTPGYPTSKPR